MTFSKRELSGVLPVFQTPYHPDETIDFDTLEREIAWLHDCGAHGIVMAMVSELLRLSSEERVELAEAACRFGLTRGVVIISGGAESSKVAERFAKQAESVGADAVMAIPPVAVGIGEDDLAAYYRRIIEATARLLPGVLGNQSSVIEESHSAGLLEYPQYTRPREFRGVEVPAVLLSGDHKQIARYRRQLSLVRTRADGVTSTGLALPSAQPRTK